MAESFGTDAGRYDRSRPSYPAALVERIVGASPGPDVLDVGCGTGIAARLFTAAGCRVLGVDVDARMADVARQHGLPVDVARFEDWEPAGRTFDTVIAAQAWHWVDPVAGAARAATVLRPGGRLAAFWNAFQPPDGLRAEFAAVYTRVLPGFPVPWARATGTELYASVASRTAEGMRAAGLLGEPEQWQFPWERPYTRDEFLDQMQTSGFQGRTAPATMSDLLAGVGAAIDAAGGSFVMGYTTVAVTAARAEAG